MNRKISQTMPETLSFDIPTIKIDHHTKAQDQYDPFSRGQESWIIEHHSCVKGIASEKFLSSPNE